jgi:hypothetical protein
MKKIHIIFIVIFILSGSVIPREANAQDMKTGSSLKGPYSDLGVDMQYYEIKYDPKSDEYIGYYQAIREKIMQGLKNLYNYHYRNGDVYLLFTIKSDGTLTGFDIDRQRSAKDRTLIDIVVTSLKRSSPFHPIPKEMALPEISFNVIISFKEK